MDTLQHMLNALLLLFSSFPLGLSLTQFWVSPPWSPQEVKVIAVICKVGNLILEWSGSKGKQQENFQFELLALQTVSATFFLCGMHGDGIPSMHIRAQGAAAAPGRCWGEGEWKSQPCVQHWNAVPQLRKILSKHLKVNSKNKTKPRSTLGF